MSPVPNEPDEGIVILRQRGVYRTFMVRKSRKQLTIRFLHRITLFLTFFSFGLILLFFFGNAQDFLDSSQFIVLSVLSASSILSTLVALTSAILELSACVRRRKRIYLAMFAVSVLCVLFSLSSALISRGILLAAAGTLR